MSFHQLITSRRSSRIFGEGEIDSSKVTQLLRAALMSPTSRNLRSWHFVMVEQKEDLQKLADAKEQGSAFLADAALAIVVLGDSTMNDCWVEDGAIAAFAIQLQAEDLGLASCWVQIRGRYLSDGTKAADVVRGILDIPESMEVLCVIALGNKAQEKEPHDEESLKWENVHPDKF